MVRGREPAGAGGAGPADTVAAALTVIALDGEPRHRVRGADEVLEQAVERVLAAEDVAAAHIVAREHKYVRVLVADGLLEEGRAVRVAAGPLLLRRADVLAEEVARVVDVRNLHDLEGALRCGRAGEQASRGDGGERRRTTRWRRRERRWPERRLTSARKRSGLPHMEAAAGATSSAAEAAAKRKAMAKQTSCRADDDDEPLARPTERTGAADRKGVQRTAIDHSLRARDESSKNREDSVEECSSSDARAVCETVRSS